VNALIALINKMIAFCCVRWATREQIMAVRYVSVGPIPMISMPKMKTKVKQSLKIAFRLTVQFMKTVTIGTTDVANASAIMQKLCVQNPSAHQSTVSTQLLSTVSVVPLVLIKI
jgi:hypothetical protein